MIIIIIIIIDTNTNNLQLRALLLVLVHGDAVGADLGQHVLFVCLLFFVFFMWIVLMCFMLFSASLSFRDLGQDVCDTLSAWDAAEGISFSNEILWTMRFVLFLGILYFSDNFIWKWNPLTGISSRRHIATLLSEDHHRQLRLVDLVQGVRGEDAVRDDRDDLLRAGLLQLFRGQDEGALVADKWGQH